MLNFNLFKTQSSIRNRLLFQLGAVTFAISLSIFLVVRLVVVQAVTATQDGLLKVAVQSVTDKIYIVDEQVSVDLPYDTFSLLGAMGEDRIFYRISENGKLLTGYSEFPYEGTYGDIREPLFSDVDYLGETYRVAATEFVLFEGKKERRLYITLAQSQKIQNSVLSKISTNLILLVFIFFIFALFVAYLSAKYTIKPINKFAKDVKKRRPADLSKVSSDVPIELLPLSQSLNSFIGRFRTALRQTETFIAEAAHHIRTPLAVVKSESELALRKSKSVENRTHLRNIIRAVDRTNRSASQLLDHAMVLYRSERPERQTFKLDQAAFEVVTQLKPAANLRDLEIYYNSEISIDDIITLDRTLWETALRNLIDNAIKYASPETVVEVSVMKQKQGYDIKIINKIAKPIKTNPSQLFKKFKRGDGTAEIIGSGLGLNIVLEATNAIGGKIKFRKIKGEAICATLSLV